MDGRVRIVAVTLTLALLLALASVAGARMNPVMLGGGVAASGSTCSGTFGWNTAASTAQGAQTNQAAAIKRTIDCTGTYSGVFNAWLSNYSSVTDAKWIAFIAKDSSGNPGEIVWASDVQTILAKDTTVAKRSIAISSVSLVSGEYWIGVKNSGATYPSWTYTPSSGTAATITLQDASLFVGNNVSGSWGMSTAERAFNVEF